MSATLRLLSQTAATQWTEEELKALSHDDMALAIDMVVRKFRDRLFYHALYIVKSSEEAYDVVQEVFIRAMRETRFFDEEFKQKAWLYRVTSNLCFNRVRDKKRRGAILESMHKTEATAPDQVDLVYASERQSEVLSAIDEMTRDHREILMLRYYDDLSYAEIAEVLDVKLGTVMSRLSRARTRLVNHMGEDHHLRP
jgi:RNA polymerase sigma-70 factor (ECF subfamily)